MLHIESLTDIMSVDKPINLKYGYWKTNSLDLNGEEVWDIEPRKNCSGQISTYDVLFI